MDDNSVSFQMFLILLSFITLGSERQISVFNNVKAILRCLLLFWRGGGGACAEAGIFSLKKNFIRHFARFNFSRLSLALVSKYHPYLACGEKIIRLASKNSEKLGEKSVISSLSDMLQETLFLLTRYIY